MPPPGAGSERSRSGGPGRSGVEGAPGSPISWAEQRRATSRLSGEARRAGPLRPLTGRRRAAPSSPWLPQQAAPSKKAAGLAWKAGTAAKLRALCSGDPAPLLCIRTPSSTCRRQVLLKRGRRKRQAGRDADRRRLQPDVRLVRGKRSSWTAAPARAALPRRVAKSAPGRSSATPLRPLGESPASLCLSQLREPGLPPLWFSGSLPGSLETEAAREVYEKECEASAAGPRALRSYHAGEPFSQLPGLELLPKRSQQGRRPPARRLGGRKAPGLPSVGTVSFKGSGPS